MTASPLPNDQLEEKIVRTIASMEPVTPRILRSAPAYAALAWGGWRLRVGSGKNFIHLSSPSFRIREFWSHSWHGRRWYVFVTALLLNNSLAAALVSSFVAVILGALYFFGYLPRVEFVADFELSNAYWGFYGGVLTYFVVLLLWPNRNRIFLDILCIDQEDEREKSLALVSMAAFLKRSDSLVVFWDPTYTRRLWCVFEFAAFLHSREQGQPQRIIIRPTIVGPCFLSVSAAVCILSFLTSFVGDDNQTLFRVILGLLVSLCFYLSISTFRTYFSSVRECQREMKEFDLGRTLCHCCSCNHVGPNGQRLTCDRNILTKCIQQWFGSTANFERQVRAEVEACLSSQLWGEMLSHKQCVLSMVPFLWGTTDSFFAVLKWQLEYLEGNWKLGGILELIRGLAWWLGVGPFLMCIAMRMAQRCPDRGSRCVDTLLNLVIVLVTAAILVGILFLEILFWNLASELLILVGRPDLHRMLEFGSSFFALTFISLAITGFRCCLTTPSSGRTSDTFTSDVPHTIGPVSPTVVGQTDETSTILAL